MNEARPLAHDPTHASAAGGVVGEEEALGKRDARRRRGINHCLPASGSFTTIFSPLSANLVNQLLENQLLGLD